MNSCNCEYNAVSIFLLKAELLEVKQRSDYLRDKNYELEMELSKSKQFEEQVLTYLFNEVDQREISDKKLKTLKRVLNRKKQKEKKLYLKLEQLKDEMDKLVIN